MTWEPKVGMKVRRLINTHRTEFVEGGVYTITKLGTTIPEAIYLDGSNDNSYTTFFEPAENYHGLNHTPVAAEDPYAALGAEIGRLVTEKNKAYGSSFQKAGDVMRILYPEGIPPEKMDDALTVVRVIDKLFRVATDKDAFGESPWKDVVGYGLLSVSRKKTGQ